MLDGDYALPSGTFRRMVANFTRGHGVRVLARSPGINELTGKP
jgi:hypothetical protein